MNLIDCFLDVEEQKKRSYLDELIEKIRWFGSTPTNQHEWKQICEVHHTLIRLAESWLLCSLFFIMICNSYPLQCEIFNTIQSPKAKPFFRDKWLPYACRLTEILRRTNSREREETYAQYSDTLCMAWRLQAIAPHPGLPNLDSIECIHLVHLKLPQDEAETRGRK